MSFIVANSEVVDAETGESVDYEMQDEASCDCKELAELPMEPSDKYKLYKCPCGKLLVATVEPA